MYTASKVRNILFVFDYVKTRELKKKVNTSISITGEKNKKHVIFFRNSHTYKSLG